MRGKRPRSELLGRGGYPTSFLYAFYAGRVVSSVSSIPESVTNENKRRSFRKYLPAHGITHALNLLQRASVHKTTYSALPRHPTDKIIGTNWSVDTLEAR